MRADHNSEQNQSLNSWYIAQLKNRIPSLLRKSSSNTRQRDLCCKPIFRRKFLKATEHQLLSKNRTINFLSADTHTHGIRPLRLTNTILFRALHTTHTHVQKERFSSGIKIVVVVGRYFHVMSFLCNRKDGTRHNYLSCISAEPWDEYTQF